MGWVKRALALVLVATVPGVEGFGFWCPRGVAAGSGDKKMQQAVRTAEDDRAAVKDRVAAIAALGEVDAAESVPLLMKLLTSMEPDITAAAVQALARHGAPAMLSGRLATGSASERRAAAFALRYFPTASTAGSLRRALSDANAEVRFTAAWSIGVLAIRLQDEALIRELVEALAGLLVDGSVDVRFWAAWAIGTGTQRLGRATSGRLAEASANTVSRARQALERRVVTETDPDVRSELERSLRKIGRVN
ncbi:MAG: HEAT repeat domain-containing protein [Candidatus Schekmanbacteria bacterium]|nr:HEAT repeat domain-containing protein [Candidatus Schekmanbacteria bacterium]